MTLLPILVVATLLAAVIPVQAGVTADPANIVIGTLERGDTATGIITLRNGGGTSVIVDIAVENDPSGTLSIDKSDATIAAGSSTTLTYNLTVAASATVGTHRPTILVTESSSNSGNVALGASRIQISYHVATVDVAYATILDNGTLYVRVVNGLSTTQSTTLSAALKSGSSTVETHTLVARDIAAGASRQAYVALVLEGIDSGTLTLTLSGDATASSGTTTSFSETYEVTVTGGVATIGAPQGDTTTTTPSGGGGGGGGSGGVQSSTPKSGTVVTKDGTTTAYTTPETRDDGSRAMTNTYDLAGGSVLHLELLAPDEAITGTSESEETMPPTRLQRIELTFTGPTVTVLTSLRSVPLGQVGFPERTVGGAPMEWFDMHAEALDGASSIERVRFLWTDAAEAVVLVHEESPGRWVREPSFALGDGTHEAFTATLSSFAMVDADAAVWLPAGTGFGLGEVRARYTHNDPPEVLDLSAVPIVLDNASPLVKIRAHVRDDIGLDRVEFLIDGVVAATATQAPWDAVVPLPLAGTTMQVSVVVTDAFGVTATSMVIPISIDTVAPTGPAPNGGDDRSLTGAPGFDLTWTAAVAVATLVAGVALWSHAARARRWDQPAPEPVAVGTRAGRSRLALAKARRRREAEARAHAQAAPGRQG